MRNIEKRIVLYSYGNDARYAYIAFIVAGVVLFFVIVCYINIKRAKRGATPFISSYLAPPSYRQSQWAYDNQQETTLPMYTADANPNQDAGYYDVNGNFNSFAAQQQQPYDPSKASGNSYNNNINNNNDVNGPAAAYTQVPGPDEAHELNDMVYQRPPGTPQNYVAGDYQTGSSAAQATNSEVVHSGEENYSRPPGPPPPAAGTSMK